VARALELEEDEVKKQCRFSGTPTFLEHTLAVVEVRLALRDACVAHPELELELWVPEPLCRHEYDIAPARSLAPFRKEVFKPDGFARLRRPSEGTYFSFFLEADLGHTSSRQFAGKVAMHQRYGESGLFGEVYGTDSFHTLVVTTGPRRVANLLALCRDLGSEVFRFTTFAQLEQSGPLAPIWQGPLESAASGLCA